jgi:redox-sensitive bicupin YhaK (pirin superfamily)
MKAVYYPATDRGHADFGWLNSYHSFSFGQWYNPEKIHFGALRVLNDDKVSAGGGFGMHPHDNMEIVSIPLKGALAHKDSTGTDGIISTGDVQIMSAGTGIRHSEYNASENDNVEFLQIWVIPKERNIKPRYAQRFFDSSLRSNKWQVVVSPDEVDGALWINQDTRFSLGNLDAGKEVSYAPFFKGNGVYLFVLEGAININDQQLGKRDAIGIFDFDNLTIKASQNAQLLAIEIPMLG